MPSQEWPTNEIGKKIETKSKNESERSKQRIVDLVRELEKGKERFSFSGIDDIGYAELKASEEDLPKFVTSIDELIERFKREGIKVVLGSVPESGNAFILPYGSNDIEKDSIPSRHLKTDGIVDGRLREVVLSDRSNSSLYAKK